MLWASIWPLAFAAMNDAGAAAFGAGPHVKSVSDVAATAIVTDHAWPQYLDSVEAREPITLESTSPQQTLRGAPPENRRGASDGTVTESGLSAGRRPRMTQQTVGHLSFNGRFWGTPSHSLVVAGDDPIGSTIPRALNHPKSPAQISARAARRRL
jgi:hypothetical protein